MIELLAPAGSPEGVRAAVQNGAGAVYIDFGVGESTGGVHIFKEEEFAAAAEYCRVRGTKCYAALGGLVRDAELETALARGIRAAELGADALLVQDLGLLRMLRLVLPSLPLHTGPRLAAHNLELLRRLESLGATRAMLSATLSRSALARLAAASPIETQILGHGRLCVSAEGYCYMSAFCSREGGSFAHCPGTCKNSYGFGARGTGYPLSMRDMTLAGRLADVESIGIRSIYVEGAARRPEYTAMVCDIFSRELRGERLPSERELKLLEEAFHPEGLSRGFYEGDEEKFGYVKPPRRAHSVLASVRADYMGPDVPRVPVRFYGLFRRGEPAQLAVQDEDGNMAKVSGPLAFGADSRELSQVVLQTQLYKLGGTPYTCTGVKAMIDPGVCMDQQAIVDLRTRALQQLTLKRAEPRPVKRLDYHAPLKYINRETPPELTVSVLHADQLSQELAGMRPAVLYVPLDELLRDGAKITPFWENGVTTICAVLPPVIHDNEAEDVFRALSRLKEIHIGDVLVSNLGHAAAAVALGFTIRADYSLGAANAQTLKVLKDAGFVSATLSFELKLSELRELSKCMDTELLVYGRVPLMVTESCLIKTSTGVCACDRPAFIKDRRGSIFPVYRARECRSAVYSAKKLYLADKQKLYAKLGLWAARLSFTTENAVECAQVMRRYLNLGSYEPVSRTGGLYY